MLIAIAIMLMCIYFEAFEEHFKHIFIHRTELNFFFLIFSCQITFGSLAKFNDSMKNIEKERKQLKLQTNFVTGNYFYKDCQLQNIILFPQQIQKLIKSTFINIFSFRIGISLLGSFRFSFSFSRKFFFIFFLPSLSHSNQTIAYVEYIFTVFRFTLHIHFHRIYILFGWIAKNFLQN